MFDQIYLGLPLWVWIIVIAIIAISVYYTTRVKTISKSETKEIIKENFAAPNPNNKPIVKIFNFNTEWCGWSIKFQPEWDAFSNYVADSKNGLSHVKAYDIKCDDKYINVKTGDLEKTNSELKVEYNVPGYPYVIIEVNGSRRSYEGDRTKEALISYVSSIIR